MKIEVNKKNFELTFGFKVFYILGKHWGMKNFNDVLKHVMSVFGDYATADVDNPAEEPNLSFATMEVLADIIMAAIVANKENKKTFADFDTAEVIESIVENIAVIPEIMKEFVSSMPSQKKEETPGK